jgi:predicted CopG family antitoxin
MSKNISLREESYERLKAHKREGESFSDVVDRLTTDGNVWAGYGALRDVDGFRAAVADGREAFDEDARTRQARIFGDEATGGEGET